MSCESNAWYTWYDATRGAIYDAWDTTTNNSISMIKELIPYIWLLTSVFGFLVNNISDVVYYREWLKRYVRRV